MNKFSDFKAELLSMLHNAEKEHEAKCEAIEKRIDKFFKEEWDYNGESNKALLPDPMMTLVALKLSQAEDKLREAQVLLSQEWYDGLAFNYMEKFSDFTEKAVFRDGKLVE